MNEKIPLLNPQADKVWCPLCKKYLQLFLIAMLAIVLVPASFNAQEKSEFQSRENFQKLTSIIAEAKQTTVRDEKGGYKRNFVKHW